MQKYLSYIKNKYSKFRYISDKNILENLDFFENINYKIVSNKIGFCIIFTDFRISKNTCFFGFLEIYEKNNSSIFLEILKKEAKNFLSTEDFSPLNIFFKKNLVGPINFSIWNNYRLGNFEKNSKIILAEYETNSELNEILLENKFKIYEKYITAKRIGENPYKIVGNFVGNSGLNSLQQDIEIKKIEINEKNLKLIFDLSCQIFEKAPKITFVEFKKYMEVYLDLYKNSIGEFVLYYKNKPIGFLSSFYNKEYFIIKTIGILKEFRGKGLGNFFLYYIYDYYINIGLEESYYLYMREKGDALNMSHKNAQIYREYFTYYIKI